MRTYNISTKAADGTEVIFRTPESLLESTTEYLMEADIDAINWRSFCYPEDPDGMYLLHDDNGVFVGTASYHAGIAVVEVGKE